jgi:uncharacterized nucleotidyltransferase DUF6036
MPREAIPEPWRSFLAELDGTLTGRCALHCMGGFVVTLVYGFSRPTSDVDVLALITGNDRLRKLIAAGGKGSLLHKKHRVYLDYVTIATVPENYEERLKAIFPGSFKYLRLLALDPYDLALAKLERNVQRDRDDVRYLARKVPLDLAILQELYKNELRPYLARPEREDLTMKLWIEMIEEDRRR